MIRDYLPKKERSKDLHLLQGWVPKDLLDEVLKIKKETGWTWDEIFAACLRNLLEEMREKNG